MKTIFRWIPITALRRYLPYKPTRRTKAAWNLQYSANAWERLRSISELARYSIIVGFCSFSNRPMSILDIGCGEGVLHELFRGATIERYVGIDISDAAIALATPKTSDRASFVCADANTYEPTERFDVVIFNECLYYFSDPVNAIERYWNYIARDGFIIVSMYLSNNNQKIWAVLEKTSNIIESTTVTNHAGITWKVACIAHHQSDT
jgi:2-polyprenyl-6-hydroxyphenyl methylase/3-demethylubiquinone-9 3-methyltransferase